MLESNVFFCHKPNCCIAHNRRMRMRIDPLVIEPIVDHRGPAFQQEDSCRAPPMADKVCHLRSLSWLGMEYKDYKCIARSPHGETCRRKKPGFPRSPEWIAEALGAIHSAQALRRPEESEVASLERRQGTDWLDSAFSHRTILAVAGEEDYNPGA